MTFLRTLVLCLFVGSPAVSAALINYQFDTLTFTDNHQITGSFTYNDTENELASLSVWLFGPVYDIEFDSSDLTSPDAFSISFDNAIFGDDADEGMQLFAQDVLVATGQYGLGDNDTCYFDPETCTNSLFTFSQTSIVVDAPQPAYLFGLGLVLLFRRKLLNLLK